SGSNVPEPPWRTSKERTPALNSEAALPAFCGPGAETSSISMPNFCSNVSLYCFLNTAVGGPPATIFASFFAASTVFFHSSCDSAEYAIAAKRSTVRMNELYMNGRLTTYPWSFLIFLFCDLLYFNAQGRGWSRREPNSNHSTWTVIRAPSDRCRSRTLCLVRCRKGFGPDRSRGTRPSAGCSVADECSPQAKTSGNARYRSPANQNG